MKRIVSNLSVSCEHPCHERDVILTYEDAVLAVATQNGLVNLEDHDFKLLYSRREDNEEELIASIVAFQDGAIRAKIEPLTGGRTQRDAFLALRKTIEMKLDRILQSVPSGNSNASSVAAAGIAAGMTDGPPAYEDEAVGVVDREKR